MALRVAHHAGRIPPDFDAVAPPPLDLEARLEDFRRLGEDHQLVAYQDGAPVARCTAATRTDLWENGRPVGLVGHFALRPDATEAGVELLAAAQTLLRDRACAVARGPVDLSTWYAYRFVLPGHDEAPFRLEPAPQPQALVCFEAAGFTLCHRYVSTEVETLPEHRSEAELAAAGLRLEDLRDHAGTDAFMALLRELHPVANAAFAQAYMFTPLSLGAFCRLYAGVAQVADPRLVLVARDTAGAAVGFAFALPDTRADRFVIKTLAVDARWRREGLGRALVAALHRRGAAMGRPKGIHALMDADGVSPRVAGALGRVLRRYGLFEKRL